MGGWTIFRYVVGIYFSISGGRALVTGHISLLTDDNMDLHFTRDEDGWLFWVIAFGKIVLGIAVIVIPQ